MKNDVYDIVPRLEWKSIVTSKWIKHAVDENIKKMQGKVHGMWLLTERRNRLRGDISTHSKIHFHQIYTFIGYSNEMEDTPDGHQDSNLEWCIRRGSVGRTTTGIRDT